MSGKLCQKVRLSHLRFAMFRKFSVFYGEGLFLRPTPISGGHPLSAVRDINSSETFLCTIVSRPP